MSEIKPDLNLIQKKLVEVKHPELKKDIVSLGMISLLQPTAEGIDLNIKTPNADRRMQIGLEAQIRQVLAKMEGIGKIKIKFEVDQNFKLEDGNRIPGVKKVIGVGKFARKRIEKSVGDICEVGDILHPSPASPKANKNWTGEIEKQLTDLGCF